jgi:hypothetical protein
MDDEVRAIAWGQTLDRTPGQAHEAAADDEERVAHVAIAQVGER